MPISTVIPLQISTENSMSFLFVQNAALTFRDYLTKVLNAMALGLFSSLIIGLIIKQIGILFALDSLQTIGAISQYFMGPAIGAAIAFSLSASPLAVFSALIAGAIGANAIAFEGNSPFLQIGEPVGALVASLCAVEGSRFIQGKTSFDLFLVPLSVILIAYLVSLLVAKPIQSLIFQMGILINQSTQLHPVLMGITLSVVMGVLLTLPVSSAAIAIALGLEGEAAGAAAVGCAAQMVGFAVISLRDNAFGSCLALGFGTSMLQIPNIIKNPAIWAPPTLASAFLGPVSTTVLKMQNTSIGAGMGTSGLVGPLSALGVMGNQALFPILLMHFFLPAILSWVIYRYMFQTGWIRKGDLAL